MAADARQSAGLVVVGGIAAALAVLSGQLSVIERVALPMYAVSSCVYLYAALVVRRAAGLPGMGFLLVSLVAACLEDLARAQLGPDPPYPLALVALAAITVVSQSRAAGEWLRRGAQSIVSTFPVRFVENILPVAMLSAGMVAMGNRTETKACSGQCSDGHSPTAGPLTILENLGSDAYATRVTVESLSACVAFGHCTIRWAALALHQARMHGPADAPERAGAVVPARPTVPDGAVFAAPLVQRLTPVAALTAAHFGLSLVGLREAWLGMSSPANDGRSLLASMGIQLTRTGDAAYMLRRLTILATLLVGLRCVRARGLCPCPWPVPGGTLTYPGVRPPCRVYARACAHGATGLADGSPWCEVRQTQGCALVALQRARRSRENPGRPRTRAGGQGAQEENSSPA